MAATEAPRSRSRSRPPVSVVVPFFGSAVDGRATLSALAGIRLRAGDEVIVADNTPAGVLAKAAPAAARVVPATQERSSYYARNVGAELARNEWLLFIDADCHPDPGLLDAYFSDPPAADCGAVAGEVVALGGDALSRWADSRGILSAKTGLAHPYRPAAVTANLLVRREAWANLGGFLEGIRSGGDSELCWRLQGAGWKLAYQPRAVVGHTHRSSVGALASQSMRYGAGVAWLDRRYPGSMQRGAIRGLARCAAGIAVWTLTGRLERARFKAFDAVAIASIAFGRLRSNAAGSADDAIGRNPHGLVLVCDAFPRSSDGPVAAQLRPRGPLGPAARIEAAARPWRPAIGGARGLAVAYREDDTAARRTGCLAWLVARHPLGVARALRSPAPAGGGRVARLATIAPVAHRLARGGERQVQADPEGAAPDDASMLRTLLGARLVAAEYGGRSAAAPGAAAGGPQSIGRR